MTDKPPLEVTDTTLRQVGSGGKGINWDAIAKLVTAMTPIFLALITYLTFVNGKKSDEAAQTAALAAQTAELTRQAMVSNDSVQGVVLDTIHTIVNSQRTHMQAQNEALRMMLKANNIKVPAGLESSPAGP